MEDYLREDDVGWEREGEREREPEPEPQPCLDPGFYSPHPPQGHRMPEAYMPPPAHGDDDDEDMIWEHRGAEKMRSRRNISSLERQDEEEYPYSRYAGRPQKRGSRGFSREEEEEEEREARRRRKKEEQRETARLLDKIEEISLRRKIREMEEGLRRGHGDAGRRKRSVWW